MWILLIIGTVLVLLNTRAILKEKNSFKGLLENKVQNITDFDAAIGELRSEFSLTILELQKEIYALKDEKDLAFTEESIGGNINIHIDETSVEEVKEIKVEKEIDKTPKDVLKEKRNNKRSEDSTQSSAHKSRENEQKEIADKGEGFNNGVRTQEIGKLLKSGASIEEVCEKFNIGKGEVLLIKELFLR
jgi:hypothetical protein